MSSLPFPPLHTVERYLEIDAASDVRNEFFDGYIVAVAGNTPEHVAIVDNLTLRLNIAFEDRPCRAWSNMLRVKSSETAYVYPDISVTCGDPVYLPTKPKTLTNPLVIVEVLSDSTERIDRREKFLSYQELDSLQHYVLVSQDEALIEVYTRQSNGHWDYVALLGSEATLDLPAIDFSVPLSMIYRGVDFPVKLEVTAETA
jgi:Uma2 family endonuclease